MRRPAMRGGLARGQERAGEKARCRQDDDGRDGGRGLLAAPADGPPYPAGKITTRSDGLAGGFEGRPQLRLELGTHVVLRSGRSWRSRALARACWDLTVPTEQPRTRAVSDSVRSSK